MPSTSMPPPNLAHQPIQPGKGGWPLAHDDKNNKSHPPPYRGRQYSRQRVPRTFLRPDEHASHVTAEPTGSRKSFLRPIDELTATHVTDQKTAAAKPVLQSHLHADNVPGKVQRRGRAHLNSSSASTSSPHQSGQTSITVTAPTTIATGKGKPQPTSSAAETKATETPPGVLKWQMWRPDTNKDPVTTDKGRDTKPGGDPVQIRDKLSKLGVTVSNPEPVRQSDVNNPISPAEWDDTKPSPQDRPVDSGWEDHNAARSHRRNRNRNRNRNRSRNPTNRASKWATKAEMAPADPQKWDRSPWSQKGDDRSTHSGWTDDKFWATAHVRKFHDETGLADWNGGWAPPPVDWDNREAFRSCQSVEKIEEWMERVEQAMGDIPWLIRTEDIEAKDGSTYRFAALDDEHAGIKSFGEIAPRYWVPESVDSTDLRSFWLAHIESTAPPPADDDDLKGIRPWFARYEQSIQGCHFLSPLKHNRTKGIDANDESPMERRKRENDRGSWPKAEARNSYEIATRRQKKLARQWDRQQFKLEKAHHAHLAKLSEARRCKPKIDLYLRYATASDLPSILPIYNHHVLTSCTTRELEPLTLPTLESRFTDILNKHHAFVVACERSPSASPDPVVGFAFADDFHSLGGVFRLTATAEFYVSPSHLRLGIGACLLDHILHILDPRYHPRGGYEVSDPPGVPRAWRTIRDVLVSFPYFSSDVDHEDHGDGADDGLRRMSAWLEETMGFARVMHLADMGVKDGRMVSLCVFRKRTGETIDPKNPPTLKVYGDLPEAEDPDAPRVVVDHDIFNSESGDSVLNPGD